MKYTGRTDDVITWRLAFETIVVVVVVVLVVLGPPPVQEGVR